MRDRNTRQFRWSAPLPVIFFLSLCAFGFVVVPPAVLADEPGAAETESEQARQVADEAAEQAEEAREEAAEAVDDAVDEAADDRDKDDDGDDEATKQEDAPDEDDDDEGALEPHAVVESYLQSMKDHEFSKAYDFVSEALKGGKDREEWSKEQQAVVQFGEVKIFGFQVFEATMEGEKAKVPNILKSQDKYLNQLGLDEYELYELIREDDAWVIDQQTLVEGPEREEYFPEE